MPGFLKIGDIAGEAADLDHPGWVLIESLSFDIHRSIPPGAKDMQRMRGQTTLGDLIVVRLMDKSSAKLAEACANGTLFKEAQVRLCTTVRNRQQPYYVVALANVVVTGYVQHLVGSGQPEPTEEISLAFVQATWTYTRLDPNSGLPLGQVPGRYDPGSGRS